MSSRVAAFIAIVLVACGDGAPRSDGNFEPDAAGLVDAGAPDGPPADAAASLPRPGFGTMTGDCDVLDSELRAAEPAYFHSAIDFSRAYDDDDLAMLTAGGQQILADGNAGGSSLLSEVFAYELLARCERAELTKTETEIEYDAPGSITDLLVDIDDTVIGVSVTRAVAFPFEDPFTAAQARVLFEDKLADIIESSAHVSDDDRWTKQILAVLAYAPGHAESLLAAYAALDPLLTTDTIVWVIVTDGDDAFLY